MGVRATFDTTSDPSRINFGIGQPSPDLMPVALFERLAARFMGAAEPLDFNYGAKRGDPRFLASLADFLTRAYGQPARPDSLFLTGGNSQALELVCERFTRPGDTVLVEEPSYFLAFQVFLDHGLEIVGVPMDEAGMRMEELEAAVARHRPKLVYTIPSFNNPSGVSLASERRRRLVELSAEHNFVIAADEVYQLLGYEGPEPPALGTMIDQGRVLSLGTFSKILAPGFRLGWIQGSAPLMERIADSGWINSGGSISHLASHVARQALEDGSQDAHIEHVRRAYGERLACMHEALQRHLGAAAQWRRPRGGYFFWLELAADTDTSTLRRAAIEAGTGFQPGALFSADGALAHCLRLSFAHYTVPEIEEGIRRLAPVLTRDR